MTRSLEMKSLSSRITVAFVIAALSSVAVFANTKKESITFQNNIKVNGTVVNKGKYDVTFDEATSELSIMKGNKVIAKASTSAAKRSSKAHRFEVKSIGTGNETELVSVTFSGMDHDIVVKNSPASR
ncbi:MAG TPA: hypothetical protein DHU55_14550 [Blastocatellia bacterium]|nr:hypothetical protein [Blastocatellia bacterium]HCX30966.1 hypothetical protein [Blastocatellia bacterium]